MVFKKRATALIILTLMVSGVLIPSTAYSQATDQTQTELAGQLVEDLREADSYARSSIIQRIVEVGEPAVPALTEVVETWRQAEDEGYVTGCMLALGQIGAPSRGATEALMEGLDAASARIRYATARALGQIWAGEGDGGEQVQNLNAALLSATYAAAYEGRGAEAYGAVMALISINEIPIQKEGRPTVSSVPLSDLRAQVGRWMANNSEALPPFEEQPWELLMAAVLRRPRSQAGREAKQMLVRDKPLAAVESITRTLRAGQLQPGSNRWAQLADVLTGITGEEMPRDPEGDAAAVVEDWTDRWLHELRGRRAEKYRAYSLRRIERIIARAKEDPSPEVLESVETMKTVLLYQLDSPDQLPENISTEVSVLLERPLKLKQQFAEALEFFQENKQAHRRLQSVKKMQQIVERREAARVARQYLDRLVEFARQEERRQILVSLARLLRNITGVPIVFGELSLDERSRRIDSWLEKVREQEENRGGETD